MNNPTKSLFARKEKKAAGSAPFLNIGTSSFLVVFLVLCLVTFAILSLTTSRSDYNLAEKAAARKTAYYEALLASEEQLGALDDLLAASRSASGSYAEYLTAVGTSLAGSPYSISSDDGLTVFISWTNEMTGTQVLETKVRLTNPFAEGEDVFYRIQSRKVTDLTPWEGDETITLMDF